MNKEKKHYRLSYFVKDFDGEPLRRQIEYSSIRIATIAHWIKWHSPFVCHDMEHCPIIYEV